jgi:hypothetical protein
VLGGKESFHENNNKLLLKKKEILTQCYTYQRLYYRLYYSNGFGLFED